MAKRNGVTVRGTSNKNVSGNSDGPRSCKAWLVETYRADVDVMRIYWPSTDSWTEREWSAGLERLADRTERVPACRCYRCGRLLTVVTVTVDRIIPGRQGGTYRRNNIRPACRDCRPAAGSKARERGNSERDSESDSARREGAR